MSTRIRWFLDTNHSEYLVGLVEEITLDLCLYYGSDTDFHHLLFYKSVLVFKGFDSPQFLHSLSIPAPIADNIRNVKITITFGVRKSALILSGRDGSYISDFENEFVKHGTLGYDPELSEWVLHRLVHDGNRFFSKDYYINKTGLKFKDWIPMIKSGMTQERYSRLSEAIYHWCRFLGGAKLLYQISPLECFLFISFENQVM